MAAAEFAGGGEQQVGAPVGAAGLPGNGHLLAVEVEALGEREPQPLDAGGAVDVARDQRRGQLVGVGDPVVAGEGVLGEQLGEIEVVDRAVEDRELRSWLRNGVYT